MKHSLVKFILHRPRNPNNIGAAARGMANFGFRNLAVVSPYAVAWREVRSAVHAHEVVNNAKKFNSLKSALRSSHLVIGTSAGSRRKCGDRWIGLGDLTRLVQKSVKARKSVALLFGSEKTGLTNEDLDFCHYVVRIPTGGACPSMNLAQAVAVLAFVLGARSEKRPTDKKIVVPKVPFEGMERLIMQGLRAFEAAGLLKGWDLPRSEGRVRRSFINWNLSQVDVAMLHGLFRWVIKKAGQGLQP